jgi:hypothetical protein
MTDLAELVAAVPVLLGFHPARSLAVLLMKGRRVEVMVRIELPEAAASAERYADHLVRKLTDSDLEADRATLVAVDQQRHDNVLLHVAEALAQVGIIPTELLWAEGTQAGQRWACVEGCHDGIVPGNTPLQVAYAVEGRAVLPSRDAVAASIAPAVDEPTLHTRAAMVSFALGDPAARQFVDPRVLGDALREWRKGRLVFDDARVALLALALTDSEIRDHVIGWLTGDSVDDVYTLLIALVRQIPAPFVAEPALLLALAAMVKGEGAMAEAALHVAESADSGRAMVGLIQVMQETNLTPSQVRSALEQATTG